jgi:SnoaL-like domain
MTDNSSASTDTTTPDHTATIDAYFAMLNEPDAGRRAALAEAAWADDCAYFDPLLEAHGRDELVEMAGGVHTQFPGQRFVRTSGIDTHHGLVRFGWELTDGEAATVVGIDVGIIAPDGRLNRIAGFFGPLPEHDAA